jgi:YfiH family protein
MSAPPLALLRPAWNSPNGVHGVSTTRVGGSSTAPYLSLNLATHVGDAARAVEENRARLSQALTLPDPPCWLEQVHGNHVVCVDTRPAVPPQADASWTSVPGRVCAILTADCVPVLMCNRNGTVVAAAHAGWRGLANGVLEHTVAALPVQADSLLAWVGPAISAPAYEVDAQVRDALLMRGVCADHFAPTRRGHWLADLNGAARTLLGNVGVTNIVSSNLCTASDPQAFFSYRRDGETGRQATLIWLSASEC